VVEIARGERLDRGDGRGLFFENGGGDGELALACKGALSGERFVEDGAKRENVAAAVELLALDLLGRHVLESADDGAFFCNGRRGRGVGEGDGGDGRGDGLGKAKVEKLGAGLGEHDVAGFEIAMNDAGAVGLVESVGDFRADLENLIGRKRAFGNALRERFALDAFHDQEIGAVLRADIEERADVWVIQSRDGFGFTLEAELGGSVGGEMVRENFDGDRAVEAGVACAVDFAHAAGTERSEDFVGAELGAGREGHGLGGL